MQGESLRFFKSGKKKLTLLSGLKSQQQLKAELSARRVPERKYGYPAALSAAAARLLVD